MNLKKSAPALKWVCYILFALLCFCLQIAPVRFGVFSNVLFVLPFVVSVASFEEIIPSTVFAVVCGFFCDYSSNRLFGFHAMIFLVLCVSVSLAMKYFVRPVFLSVIAAISCAVVVYSLFDFFFFNVLLGYTSLFSLFVSEYLSQILKTIFWSVGISYIAMKIYKISPVKAKFDS